MRWTVFFMLICLNSMVGKACEEFSPDINGLFEADVILTGNIELVDFSKCNVVVDEVLINRSNQTFALGQKVLINRPRYSVVGGPNMESIPGKFIVYLRKFEDRWVCYGGSQQIRAFVNGKIPFKVCHSNALLTPIEYRGMALEFMEYFEKTGQYSYQLKMEESLFLNRSGVHEMVQDFYECYPNVSGLNPVEPEPVPEPGVGGRTFDYVWEYFEVDEKPEYPGGNEALMKYVQLMVKGCVFSEPGTVFLEIIIERNGTIKTVIVRRGVNEQIDDHAVNIIKNMPAWKPAAVQGKAVRTKMIIPVKFRL